VYGGEHQGKLWCSTKVDSTGTHINGEGNYGFCSSTCTAVSLFDLIGNLLGEISKHFLRPIFSQLCLLSTVESEIFSFELSFILRG